MYLLGVILLLLQSLRCAETLRTISLRPLIVLGVVSSDSSCVNLQPTGLFDIKSAYTVSEA